MIIRELCPYKNWTNYLLHLWRFYCPPNSYHTRLSSLSPSESWRQRRLFTRTIIAIKAQIRVYEQFSDSRERTEIAILRASDLLFAIWWQLAEKRERIRDRRKALHRRWLLEVCFGSASSGHTFNEIVIWYRRAKPIYRRRSTGA